MKLIQQLKQFPSLTLLIVYSLSFSPILLNFHGVYWDDWTLYNQTGTQWLQAFIENGGWPLSAPLHGLFLNLFKSVYLYHVAAFLVPFLSSILLFKTLIQVFPRYKNSVWIFIATYLTLPILQARITMICLPILVSMLYFHLAWYLYTLSHKRQSIGLRVLSLLLFSYSFIVKSLIFLFCLPFASFILLKYNKGQFSRIKLNPRSLFSRFKSHLDYLILPFTTYLLMTLLTPNNGVFEQTNYNAITTNSAARILEILIATSKEMLRIISFNHDKFDLLAAVILGLVTSLFIGRFTKLTIPRLSKKNLLGLFAMGAIVSLLAMLPYVLIEKYISHDYVDTRHQLLLPFGLALLVLSITLTPSSLLKRSSPSILLLSTTLFFFASINTRTYLSFIKVWFYNESIMTNMSAVKEIQDGHGFIVEESFENISKSFFSAHRFYEYTGFARKVTSRQHNFFQAKSAVVTNGHQAYLSLYKSMQSQEHYNFKSFSRNNIKYSLVIDSTSQLSITQLPSLLVDYLIFPKQFKSDIKLLRPIEIKPLATQVSIRRQ